MKVWQRLANVNLSIWVITGALLGILCGAFFGESAAVLEPVGDVYVMLLQMAVFPFLISALLHGLGSLSQTTAWRLLKSGAPLMLLAWMIVFAALFVLAHAIPEARPPVVAKYGTDQGVSQLVSLLIPANPFADLTRNYIPAIVVFCIFYGVAIQRVQRKQGLLESLDAFRQASGTIWSWVVRISPLGVFALFSDLAGTVQLQLLGGLLLYGGLFVIASLILTLWVLPSLIAALAPVSYKEVLVHLQEALVVAVVTSLPITAVPYIVAVAQKLVERENIHDKDRDDVVATTMAVSYPFAQLGNLFVFFFIVFAAFYVHSSLPGTAWASLPAITVLSTVGTPVATVDAVGFIAEYLGMPEDIKLLYVEMMTLTRYPQVLLSTMGIAFVTILVSFAFYGLVRVNAARLTLSIAISIVLVGGLTAAGRSVEPLLIERQANPYVRFTLDSDLAASVNATVQHDQVGDGSLQGTAPPSAGTTMQRIQQSGVLRVGYGPEVIPFSYLNADGDLVGFDISYAYALARDLGVRLELHPITSWDQLSEALGANRFDLALGGIYVTPKRLRDVTVSDTYLETLPALIVDADDTDKFVAWDRSESSEDLKVAVFDSTVIKHLADRFFPEAQFETVADYGISLKDINFDAAVWTLEQARAWALANVGYTAVVPKDAGAPLSLAFLMPPNSPVFLRYVHDWLDLQRVEGFQAAQKSYWLEGKPRSNNRPRWSILRNVLGWVD